MGRILRRIGLICFGLLALNSVAVQSAETITCLDPAQEVELAVAVAFAEDRASGEVLGARLSDPDYELSTYTKDDRQGDVIAFSQVAFDRIEFGLESPGAGPMTLVAHLVRMAVHHGDGGPDTDIVVAGVARYGTQSTVTLVCSAW